MENTYPQFPGKVTEMLQKGMDPEQIALELGVPPAQVRRVIGRRLKRLGLQGKSNIKNAVAEAETRIKRLERGFGSEAPPVEELESARRDLAELSGMARSVLGGTTRKKQNIGTEDGWLF